MAALSPETVKAMQRDLQDASTRADHPQPPPTPLSLPFSTLQQQSPMILDLPREVQLAVLTFVWIRDLVACSSVCRDWRALARDRVLWRRRYITDEELPLIPRAVAVDSLVLQNELSLVVPIANIRRLDCMNVVDGMLELDIELPAIVRNAPLVFLKCSLAFETEESLSALPASLTHLDVANGAISDGMQDRIVERCPNLQYLGIMVMVPTPRLAELTQLTHMCLIICEETQPADLSFFTSLPRLHSLSIELPECNSCSALASVSRSLRFLHIFDYVNATQLAAVLKGRTGLQHLHCQTGEEEIQKVVDALLEHCPALVSLELTSLSDGFPEDVLSSLPPSLTFLALRTTVGAAPISRTDLELIAERCPGLHVLVGVHENDEDEAQFLLPRLWPDFDSGRHPFLTRG